MKALHSWSRAFAALVIGVIGVLASVVSSASLGRQDTVFRARTETVRIDVLVTERGVTVKGLAADDFEVLDNGIPQRVELITHEPLPLGLVLALDASESVEGNRLASLVAASNALLDALEPNDSVTLLTFNHALALRTNQSRDPRDARAALAAMQGEGMTALRDAAYAGLLLGENAPGRGIVVIFSDGFDTSSWLSRDQVLSSARLADVLVYAVTLDVRQPEFLRELATATGGTVFQADSEANLKTVFLQVLEDFRNRYLIGYQPTRVAPRGWHTLQVRVKGRGFNVKARPGYMR